MSAEDFKSYGGPKVPVMWRNPDGSATRSDSPVIHPDEMDPLERQMLTETFNTCGQCKYFEHAHGQAEMRAQRFAERLVREDNWQVKHLISPLNELGVCGAHSAGTGSEDQTLTGTMHKACDQFRPTRGLINLRRTTLDER